MSKALKIGLVVLVIIVILVISFAISYVRFERRVADEVRELFKEAEETGPEVISEADLEGLPEPVQKYLRYAQIVGKKRMEQATKKKETKGVKFDW